MKTCFKCNEEKDLSQFYKHKMMADGYLGKCKECAKKDARDVRLANVDYYRSYDNKRYLENPNRRKATGPLREKFPKGTSKERWVAKNPDKRAAHILVGNAVRDGKLEKATFCQICGSKSRLDGHHHDYSKPLDVIWVCRKCHISIHKGEK